MMSEPFIAPDRQLPDHPADVIDREDEGDVDHRTCEQERIVGLIDERMAASRGTGATLAEVMAEVAARP